jgi:hypothetical protein
MVLSWYRYRYRYRYMYIKYRYRYRSGKFRNEGNNRKSALRGISAGREWGIPPGRDFATEKA